MQIGSGTNIKEINLRFYFMLFHNCPLLTIALLLQKVLHYEAVTESFKYQNTDMIEFSANLTSIKELEK